MSPKKFQAEFLQRLGDLTPLGDLLDQIPDTAVFLKDRQGRFVYQNRTAYEACGVASVWPTVGRRDADFFPAFQADLYTQGDKEVMESGLPMLNRIEPAPDAPGGLSWVVCSKYPLRDRRGRIIGVACMYRRISGRGALPGTTGRIARAVDAIHQRYGESLTSTRLAALAGVSRRTFDAQFRRILGVTAQDYLLRVRIDAATRLLVESDRPVTAIALEVGFYDHSHFSRSFHRLRGISPSGFRRQRRI